MDSLKIKAIILRSTKYAEADLILTFLSVDGEKFSGIAKGALKSKKRFPGGILEPTHFVELVLNLPTQKDRLPVIEQAVLLEGFEKLRTDYDRLTLALKILEPVSKMAQEGHLQGDIHSKDLFNLLGHGLRELQHSNHLEIFQIQFLLKLLLQQGVLDPEPWMTEFLTKSLKDHALIVQKLNLDKNKIFAYLAWCEEQIKNMF